MKLYKKVFIFLGICLSVYLIYVMILLALTFGHQRMPQVDVSKELIQLKKEIEADKIEIIFSEITEIELEECNAKQEVTLRVTEDSITKSKEALDKFINSINKKINERLVDKKCIDSLIVDVSAFYSKGKNKNLQNYRYSFPIKK